jgi:hypothetical protein
LHGLRRETEALPKSFWRRLQAWIGISLGDEKTLLSGLARRLGWATAGVAVVLVMAPLTSPWIGLTVLAIWWLPLLWHIIFRLLAAGVCLGLVIAAVVIRPLNPRMPAGGARTISFLVLTCLELILLILAFAYAGGSLLSEAMQPAQ